MDFGTKKVVLCNFRLLGLFLDRCIASVGIGQILEKCYSFVDIFERDLV